MYPRRPTFAVPLLGLLVLSTLIFRANGQPTADATAPATTSSTSIKPPSYSEKYSRGNTTVTFEADALAGKNRGIDSIRLVLHPNRPDIACVGKYDYVTDRELTPITLKYAFRATLKCMNPCFTDDDLDVLTSCDDWSSRADKLRSMRRAAGPLYKEGDPTELDIAERLISDTMGCEEDQLERARKEGHLSDRIVESGKCKQLNAAYKPSDPPPAMEKLTIDSGPLRDADLEFSRFRTLLYAAFLLNDETSTTARLGGALLARWYFAGPHHIRASAGLVQSEPIGSIGFYRSPSRFEWRLAGSALLAEKGVQRSTLSAGEVGLGVPNRTGASTVLLAPITYYRDIVAGFGGLQTHIRLTTEQSLGRHILVGAGAKAGILYAGSATAARNLGEGEQEGVGSILGTDVQLTFLLADTTNPTIRFIPTLSLAGNYERQRVTATGIGTPTARAPLDILTAQALLGLSF